MRFDQLARILTGAALVVLVSIAATACGGGGGNGGGGTAADAVVVGISIPGVAGGNNFVRADGSSTLVPNVFLNGRIVITLGGNVDPASLPAAGPAVAGPVEIVSLTSGAPARGVFTINPSNPRQVIFDAFPPTSVQPGQGCVAGFNPNEQYRISVTAAGSNLTANVLMVSGHPLVQGAAGTFTTISCNPGSPSAAFTDSNGQDPSVVAQNPAPGSTLLVGQLPGFPTNSIITLDVDESLDPSTVNPNNLILVNKTINGTTDTPVGGAVSFEQFGSVAGNPSIARITFATTVPLDDGHTYEFVFLGVTDLAGNPLQAPAAGTSFNVTNEMNNAQSTFFDDFSTTANLGSLTEAIAWPGTSGSPHDGRVAAVFPEPIVGNGLDGAGTFSTSMTINADNQMTPGDPNATPATYNFTTVDFGNPANMPVTIDFTSTTDTPPGEANFPVHFRSQGNLTILPFATLSFDGRRQTIQGGQGQVSTTVSIPGGWGGPGGGRGGVASPTNTPGFIDPFGGPGEGAHYDPMDNTKPGGQTGNIGDVGQPPVGLVDFFYGGGGAGAAGVNLTTTPAFGPGGGGGGRATGFMGYNGMPPSNNANISFSLATGGETQAGTDGLGTGAPPAGVAGKAMPAMMTPLLFAVGGSGGGASGDRGNATAANPPGSYRAGAPGGGGGGACRMTAGGDISFGVLSVLSLKGGEGGSAAGGLTAHGGGGSGGSLLAQTFGTLTPSPSATFDTSGGPKGVKQIPDPMPQALNGEGGRGGDGVVQFEDGTGGFITTGLAFITVRGELFTRVFPSAGTISDIARSIPIDTGSSATDYISAMATTSTGTNAMSTISVQIIGVAEDPNNPGQPATSATTTSGFPLMVGPVPFSQIDQIDGYRYFIIEIATSYPSPPTVNSGDVLPFADDVTVIYSN